MRNFNIKETTFRDLLSVLFRHKLVLIITFIIIMSTVYISIELRTPIYIAEVKMLLSVNIQRDLKSLGEDKRDYGYGSPLLTQMEILKSRPIVKRVVKALRLDKRPIDHERRFASRLKRVLLDNSYKKRKKMLNEMDPKKRESYLSQTAFDLLSNRINAYRAGETSLFIISVRDFDPNLVVVLANSISRSYVMFDMERQIADLQLIYSNKHSTIRKLQQHINNLEETLDGRLLPDLEAIGPANVKVIAQATESYKMVVKPSKKGALIIAFIMSIISGIVIVFGLNHFKQTLASPKDIESHLNIPLLGTIPYIRRKENKFFIENINSDSRQFHAYQSLSNQIFFLLKEKRFKSILMITMNATKNSSAVIANLARNLSGNEAYKTLIIDANMRLLSGYPINNNSGLVDVLNGKVLFEESVCSLDSNLSILPSGDIVFNPISLLESSAMSGLLNKVKDNYDAVIVDSNIDLKNISDVLLLSTLTDGVIILLDEGGTRRLLVQDIIGRLEEMKINVIGVILNNCRYPIPEIVYRFT